MKGTLIGGGLVAAAAFLSRGRGSLGRYLSPNDDEDTVAAEFVDRIKRAAWKTGFTVDEVRSIRVVTSHKHFNIQRAFDIWFDECLDEWDGQTDEDEWGVFCDNTWQEILEHYDDAVRSYMRAGKL